MNVFGKKPKRSLRKHDWLKDLLFSQKFNFWRNVFILKNKCFYFLEYIFCKI